MSSGSDGRPGRHGVTRGLIRLAAALAVAAVPLLSAGLGRVALEGVRAVDIATATLADLLVPLAAAAGAACGGVLTFSTLAIAALPAGSALRRRASAVTPRAWRRLVTIAVGGGLAMGAALPAAAASAVEWRDPDHPESGLVTSHAGWVAVNADAAQVFASPSTDTPLLESQAPSATKSDDHTDDGSVATHTVTRGESLWAITARIRGGDDRDVAKAWPELYSLNRDIVGPDPDLLLPGQELRIPAGWSA